MSFASAVAPLVDRLCALSRRAYANPYEVIEWPERLPEDALCMSPELVSLYKTGAWETLGEAGRRRLAFYEAVNFFSLNIHGETALLQGIARRIGSRRHAPWREYLHHFLDEENKHMVWFETFCRRYAGKVYPDRKVVFPREVAPGEEDVLFFAKIAIFEEIVDVYNARMSADERLHVLVRRINLLHHRDESRHLAFGRTVLKTLVEEHALSWSDETRAQIGTYLEDYLEATWREYYNPHVYRDAGLPDPYDLAEEAFASETAREHRADVAGRCLRFLRAVGLVEEESP